jgi:hypothetical protein
VAADLVFAVGACRSVGRDPLRSADSHVPLGQSFELIFHLRGLGFFCVLKNSFFNGMNFKEMNENVFEVKWK